MNKEIMASIESGSVPYCKEISKKAKKKMDINKTNALTSSASMKNNSKTTTSIPSSPINRTSSRNKRPRSMMATNDAPNNDGNECNDNDDDFRHYCGGVLKPGVTFFGETLDNSVGRKIESDKQKADALIVIGTSLSVAPISRVIEYLPRRIPRILINRTIVHPKTHSINTTKNTMNTNHNNDGGDEDDFRTNYVFDAYLLGFCDDVTRALGKQLGLGFDIKNNGKTKLKAEEKIEDIPKKKRPRQKTISNKEESSSSSSSSSSSTTTLISSDNNEWSSITIPKERVILFPGALATCCSSSKNGKKVSDQDETKIAAEETYHVVAHCDGCSQLIHGTIFKCSKCFDYDLCKTCYPKLSKLHCNGQHVFHKE